MEFNADGGADEFDEYEDAIDGNGQTDEYDEVEGDSFCLVCVCVR